MERQWDHLADYIRSEMARRRWSQRDLAGESGVSERTISDLLSGRPRKWLPRTMPRIELAIEWDPGTAERVLLGATPDGDISRENYERALDDILARARKLPDHERKRFYLAVLHDYLREESSDSP